MVISSKCHWEELININELHVVVMGPQLYHKEAMLKAKGARTQEGSGVEKGTKQNGSFILFRLKLSHKAAASFHLEL